MADYINNVAAADGYTAALTVGPDFAANSAVITVANNPVLMQFAVGKLGDWRWTDEREFFSIPQSFRVGKIIGVKFRNANPGQVARVLAVLAGDDDPDFQSGTPFSGFLTTAGSINPSGGVTGSVSGAGAIVAGTGFTVVRGSAGRYTVTFTTAFASPPLVLITSFAGSKIVIDADSVTAAGFNVTSDTTAGAAVDTPFGFLAQLFT